MDNDYVSGPDVRDCDVCLNRFDLSDEEYTKLYDSLFSEENGDYRSHFRPNNELCGPKFHINLTDEEYDQIFTSVGDDDWDWVVDWRWLQEEPQFYSQEETCEGKVPQYSAEGQLMFNSIMGDAMAFFGCYPTGDCQSN